MKIIAPLFLAILLYSCNNDNVLPNDFYGIEKRSTGSEEVTEASGQLLNQNNETIQQSLIAYQVKAAFIKQSEANTYHLKMNFITKDSLSLYILKQNDDLNFHSDAKENQNTLLLSIFNQDTLEMEPGALSLQPVQENNTFTAVTNLHTINLGDFNGTVKGIPFLVE